MNVFREMPKYQCHKQVWALKIKEVRQAPANQERQHAGGDWYLVPEEGGYAPICVGHDTFYAKHRPQPGGYYVVYEDGYASYSPAAAFEAGYSLVPPTDHFLAGKQACGIAGESCEACQ